MGVTAGVVKGFLKGAVKVAKFVYKVVQVGSGDKPNKKDKVRKDKRK